MYQGTKKQCHQITLFDFNQSCGMQLDQNNEWILLSDRIAWNALKKIRRHVPVHLRPSCEAVLHGFGSPHYTEAEEAF